jgi:hypothetical protein
MNNVIVRRHFFTLTKQHKRMTSWAHYLLHTCKMMIKKRVKEEDDDDDSAH